MVQMVETLSPDRLHEKRQAGESVQIVDTRPPAVYADGHIPGAENVPYAELANRIDEIDWADEIVLVCQEGISSEQAARLLESYEGIGDDTVVANLEGGYDEWEYDLESEERS